ncbi:unnamed protein product [Absidia cylindrospora]
MRSVYTYFILVIAMLGLSMAAEPINYDHTVLSRWHAFELSLNTKSATVKQAQRQWTLFSGTLKKQYPNTASQLDQIKQLTRHYKSVTQWQNLATSIKTKLDLPSSSPTPTKDVSHDNQATW